MHFIKRYFQLFNKIFRRGVLRPTITTNIKTKNLKMKNSILAVDLGFGSTKVGFMMESGAMHYTKYTSAIAKVDSKSYINDENAFTFENEHYYLFDNALRLPNGSTMDLMSYEGLRTASPIMLRKIMMDLNINSVDSLVLGLSISMINFSADYKQYISKTLNINPATITLVPQGIGAKVAYDNYGIDPNGSSNLPKSSNYLGIDIGFNTVDIFQVINGAVSSNGIAGLEHKGVSVAAGILMKKLEDEISLDIQECKAILTSGNQQLRGSVIDRKELVAEIVTEYIKSIITDVEAKYSASINKMDNIIFFGGGAALLTKYMEFIKPKLDEVYPEGFLQVVSSPEYYNVAGYYSIGLKSRNDAK